MLYDLHKLFLFFLVIYCQAIFTSFSLFPYKVFPNFFPTQSTFFLVTDYILVTFPQIPSSLCTVYIFKLHQAGERERIREKQRNVLPFFFEKKK